MVSMIDIIIVILAIVAVISIIFYQIKKSKRTDEHCNGNCSECNKKH